jgi:hypothetical protein
MYFPYLRARQFELIALRELSAEPTFKNNVVPVLEPVRESVNGLVLANKIFHENNFNPFLIVNPLQGEMAGDTNYFLNFIRNIEGNCFRAALIFTNNADYILNCITDYSLSDVMLICLEGFVDEGKLRDLCENSRISHIMVLNPHKNRHLDRFIKGLGKFYIRLDDVFDKKEKNADYLDIEAHKFTEEHLFYKEEGFDGFSDFTVLPGEFVDGGSTPRAVVIHLSYINEDSNNEIWVRHFTSNTNDSIVNVQLKFAEATSKAIRFVTDQGLDNAAISELKNYFEMEKYPGLGTVKKISIKNHLIIVSDYLNIVG